MDPLASSYDDGIDNLVGQINEIQETFSEVCALISSSLDDMITSVQETNKAISDLSTCIKDMETEKLKEISSTNLDSIIGNLSSATSNTQIFISSICLLYTSRCV